jgi:hypothetical protein
MNRSASAKVQQPKAKAFFDLSIAIDREIDRVQWFRESPSREQMLHGVAIGELPIGPRFGLPAPSGTDAWRGGGLLDALALSGKEPPPPPEPPPFVPDTSALDALLTKDTAARWLARRPELSDLYRHLGRKAARRGEQFERYRRPEARYLLLSRVAFSVGMWRRRLETKTKPAQPSRRDWRDALAAIDTLKAISAKGVWLDRAFAGEDVYRSLPFGWLDTLGAALASASKKARKAHVDEGAIEREAVKAFAHSLLSVFGEAPPVMVEAFAALVDYQSGALRKRHLPEWVRQYRARSLV